MTPSRPVLRLSLVNPFVGSKVGVPGRAVSLGLIGSGIVGADLHPNIMDATIAVVLLLMKLRLDIL